MDSCQFDALARAVIAAPSRRQLFWLLGGTALSALTAPLSRSHHVAAQETTCQIGKVTVWVSAFIPGDVPGVTLVVPDGPYKGQKMLRNPLNVLGYYPGDCFITDNRDFKADPGASARMHSLIEIDVAAETIVGGGMGTQRIGETVELDCEDGSVECQKTGPTNRMAFSNFQVQSGFDGERIFSVDLKAAGQDWCFEWSPQSLVCDIDYRGTFSILVNKARDQAHVGFAGDLDEFPAYEVYAAADGQPAVTLLRESPLPGKTPFALCKTPVSSAAPPPRHVTGAATLRCTVGDVGLSSHYQGVIAVGDAELAGRLTRSPGQFQEFHDLSVAIQLDLATNTVVGGSMSYELPAPAARVVFRATTAAGVGPFQVLPGGILGAMIIEGERTTIPYDEEEWGGPWTTEDHQSYRYASDASGRVVVCAADNSWDHLRQELETQRQQCVDNAFIELQSVSAPPPVA